MGRPRPTAPCAIGIESATAAHDIAPASLPGQARSEPPPSGIVPRLFLASNDLHDCRHRNARFSVRGTVSTSLVSARQQPARRAGVFLSYTPARRVRKGAATKRTQSRLPGSTANPAESAVLCRASRPAHRHFGLGPWTQLEYELVKWEPRTVWCCGACGGFRHHREFEELLPAICCGQPARLCGVVTSSRFGDRGGASSPSHRFGAE